MFVSILLSIALIFGFFHFNNQISDLNSRHNEQLTKLESERNQQIKNLKDSNLVATDSHLETIANLQDTINELSLESTNSTTLETNNTQDSSDVSIAKTVVDPLKSAIDTTSLDTLVANLKNNIRELEDKISQKDALIDAAKSNKSSPEIPKASCPEVTQNPSSCASIDDIEMQLIEKHSQLTTAQKDLSLAKSRITVLKDEKVRANEAISNSKVLKESLLTVENKLQSALQKLEQSANEKTELDNIISRKNESVQSLNNKINEIEKELVATENDLSSSATESELKDVKLSKTSEKLNDTTSNLSITSEKLKINESKLKITEAKLRATEELLKITKEAVQNQKDMIAQQNRIIISKGIDRIKALEEDDSKSFSVYLSGFTEEQIKNYCLTIQNAPLEIEAFGMIISADDISQNAYKEFCVSTNLDN